VEYLQPLHVGNTYVFETYPDKLTSYSEREIPITGRVYKDSVENLTMVVKATFFIPTVKQASKILQIPLDELLSRYFLD
jgi:hypothetical protein